MFRLIKKNTYFLRSHVSFSGIQAKYYGKDNANVPPNQIPVYNESDKIQQRIGSEPKMTSMNKLRHAAIRGIRFHEMQIQMHQEELRKHRKNLIRVSEMIHAQLKKNEKKKTSKEDIQ